jgi:glutathione S-transferase
VKLYTGPLSLFSAKIRIALEEKGIEVKHVQVGWSLEHRYRPHHPDVVALNPKAQVPVLIDGETVVGDSTLILEYLEERHPESPLFPSGLAARARCRRLEAFADEIFFPPVWDLIESVFYAGPDTAASAGRAAAARDALSVLYARLEAELGDRAYFCGDFSVADIALFVMIQAAIQLGAAPGPEHGGLAGWLERTGARPAVKRDTEAMQAFAARTLATARAS